MSSWPGNERYFDFSTARELWTFSPDANYCNFGILCYTRTASPLPLRSNLLYTIFLQFKKKKNTGCYHATTYLRIDLTINGKNAIALAIIMVYDSFFMRIHTCCIGSSRDASSANHQMMTPLDFPPQFTVSKVTLSSAETFIPPINRLPLQKWRLCWKNSGRRFTLLAETVEAAKTSTAFVLHALNSYCQPIAPAFRCCFINFP